MIDFLKNAILTAIITRLSREILLGIIAHSQLQCATYMDLTLNISKLCITSVRTELCACIVIFFISENISAVLRGPWYATLQRTKKCMHSFVCTSTAKLTNENDIKATRRTDRTSNTRYRVCPAHGEKAGVARKTVVFVVEVELATSVYYCCCL